MHRVGLGILLFLLSCNLLQADEGRRLLVGVHSGLLVPSLNRIEESEALSDWRYDIGWGISLNANVAKGFSVCAMYDLYPIRYHGLADRSDVRSRDISGRYGFIHHMAGELLYNFLSFNNSRVFVGGSYDYFYADQTAEGSYIENDVEVTYEATARVDKGAFGLPLGITSYINDRLGFSFRVKPIFYWWNDESTLQFITAMTSISFGYAF